MARPSTSLHCIWPCLASLTPTRVGLGLTWGGGGGRIFCQSWGCLSSQVQPDPCSEALRAQSLRVLGWSVLAGALDAVPLGEPTAACWVLETSSCSGMRHLQAEPISAQPLPPKICCVPLKFLQKGFRPELPSALKIWPPLICPPFLELSSSCKATEDTGIGDGLPTARWFRSLWMEGEA